MNLTNDKVISMLQVANGVSTIGCTIGHSSQVYVYKTILEDLKPGDLLIAQIRDQVWTETATDTFSWVFILGLVRVVTIHEIPEIDPDADFEYKWAFQKVDDSALLVILEEEAIIKKQIAQATKRLESVVGLKANEINFKAPLALKGGQDV